MNSQDYLDRIDLKILRFLQQDASLSNLALAAKLALSPPTCLRRVKRLNDGGWIAQQVAVQQCWRVSSGPDFVLVVQALSMPDYLDVTRRLLTQDANVRNVKAFFSVKRAKFSTAMPLPLTEDLAKRIALS